MDAAGVINMGATRRGRAASLVVALVTLCVTAFAVAAPVRAAPGDYDEGVAADLQRKLEDASRGYLDAERTLVESRKRQADLAGKLRDAEARVEAAVPKANEILAATYRTGGPASTASLLLGSGSAGGFVDRAASLRVVAARNERVVRDLVGVRRQLAEAKTAIDNEIKLQEQQLAVMAKRKQDAERALAEYGTGEPEPDPVQQPPAPPSGGRPPQPPPGPPPAQPAPGNGTFPPERCSVDDPTTSGCLTPRTLHALNQAKSAGFTRFVSCYRSREDGGEHPRGRACDFAAQRNGFGGVATGGDRAYGDSLSVYFIDNSRRLGVLYVIWFKRIWLPSSGWRAYRSGRGDPSSDHTNHVHLSVR
jgi:peptidoglycan DL-endopeptidase CwlO